MHQSNLARPHTAAILVFPLVVALVPAQGGEVVPEQGTIRAEQHALIAGPAVAPPPRMLGNDATPHDHGKTLPQLLPGSGTLPQPVGDPAWPVHPASPAAPCDLELYIDEVVKPAGASTSTVGEPSAANLQDTAWFTGNWFAARSIDSGTSWTYVSPYTAFPAPDGGFCCDQRTVYIPSHDITVWVLQYSYSTTTQQGGTRIAIANGRADLQAGTGGAWHSFYFDPGNFGRPQGEWLDFPDLAFSSTYLYVSSNVFTGPAGNFSDAVAWRMPLSQLAAGGGIVQYQYVRRNLNGVGTHSYRFTQNAGSTMYFAGHDSTTSLRAYRWPDGGNVTWTNITVPAWTNVGMVALAPNGVNWGGRSDGRITGGYFRGGSSPEYGFLWTSAPISPRTNCFVRVARIDANTHALVAAEDIFSSVYDILYPAAAVNARGDVGVCFAVGSSTVHPTSAFLMVDSCRPSFLSQIFNWFQGNASPSNPDRWGDYFTVQRHAYLTNTFVGTGMTLRNGGANANQEPHYVHFGREQDQVTDRTLDVMSTGVAVPITLNVRDRNGLQNGTTPFQRLYAPGQTYVLTAPASIQSGGLTWTFSRWSLRDRPSGSFVEQPAGQLRLEVDIGITTDTAIANYHVIGRFTPFGSACAGTNGVPVHTGNGTPEVGFQATYHVSNAAGFTSAHLWFGFSNTSYQGIPLPLRLDFMGITGCSLLVSRDVALPFVTNAAGSGQVNVPFANDPNAIGAHLYSQVLFLDLANGRPTPITLTNGLDTLIGGTR
jgi:hypothetical protein